jgi:hypothetical protein
MRPTVKFAVSRGNRLGAQLEEPNERDANTILLRPKQAVKTVLFKAHCSIARFDHFIVDLIKINHDSAFQIWFLSNRHFPRQRA